MKKFLQIVDSGIFLMFLAVSVLINGFLAYLLYQNFQESYEESSNTSCSIGDFEMPFELAIEPTILNCDFGKYFIEDLEKLYVNCHKEYKNEYYYFALKKILENKCGNNGKEIKRYLLGKLLENTSGENLNLNLSGDKVIFSGELGIKIEFLDENFRENYFKGKK